MSRYFYESVQNKGYYYLIKGTKPKEETLRLIRYSNDGEYTEYLFCKTDKYRATKTLWNDDICKELECDILSKKVEVLRKINYRITDYKGYCAYAKHFVDGPEYRWNVPLKLFVGLEAGDSVYADTKRGERIVHITKIEKIDENDRVPHKSLLTRCKKFYPFITTLEYHRIKDRKLKNI